MRRLLAAIAAPGLFRRTRPRCQPQFFRANLWWSDGGVPQCHARCVGKRLAHRHQVEVLALIGCKEAPRRRRAMEQTGRDGQQTNLKRGRLLVVQSPSSTLPTTQAIIRSRLARRLKSQSIPNTGTISPCSVRFCCECEAGRIIYSSKGMVGEAEDRADIECLLWVKSGHDEADLRTYPESRRPRGIVLSVARALGQLAADRNRDAAQRGVALACCETSQYRPRARRSVEW